MSLEMAIDPFGKRKGLGRVGEGEIKREVNVNDKLMKMFSLYDDYLLGSEIEYDKLSILNPAEIDFLLQTLVEEGHAEIRLGQFVSKLIQKSYDDGHNDFVLDTGDGVIPSLCSGLEGKISVTVRGDVGYNFGRESNGCEFKLYGDVGRQLGSYSKGCSFYVEGDVDTMCAFEAEGSSFKIIGNVKDYLGTGVLKCDFDIKGDVGKYMGNSAKKSRFKVSGKVGRNLGFGAYSCEFHILSNDVTVPLYYQKTPIDCTYYVRSKELKEKFEKPLSENNKVILC